MFVADEIADIVFDEIYQFAIFCELSGKIRFFQPLLNDKFF